MRKLVIGLGLLVIAVGVYFLVSSSKPVVTDPEPAPAKVEKSIETPPRRPTPRVMPGVNILQGYASESQSPERDLEQVREMVSNTMMLVKNRDPREYATNEDLADFLRGKNQYQQTMLPAGHGAFDAQGRLVDRWGKPLIVHVISKDRVEIFGPGPDGIPWTDDDIGRRSREAPNFGPQ